MKAQNNWLDALASLKESMPEQTPEPEAPRPKPVKSSGPRPKLSLFLEKKGRAGKTATIITGFPSDTDIEAVASLLKKRLATGGSARGGEILIQGDRRSDIIEVLKDSYRF